MPGGRAVATRLADPGRGLVLISLAARELPEVVVEGVVLFNDDDYVLNWTFRCHDYLLVNGLVHV